ncbi:hypothetical protein HMI01_16850 [Halolactibacillus miurensis]|uniref:Uncharacterized protein n=1 Tax=Halolactibacillus miurensis TaxID=306541 RepID=A0A1I6TJ53_9BACI|nr:MULTISPECIES: hypothetical protein [Halolactibacillus]GEM04697.1 hypothetical protein HMI01_16850 [Halolactibacillus miurensis]SFS89204.1 hypothetical protein SAMN05421668_11566 [Halolactibacillus miurensis]
MTRSLLHALFFGVIFTFGSFIGQILLELFKETPTNYSRVLFISIFTGIGMMMFELIYSSKKRTKRALLSGVIFTSGSFIGQIIIALLKETPVDYSRAVFVSIFTGIGMAMFELIRFSKKKAKLIGIR